MTLPLPRSLTRYARSFDCGERWGFDTKESMKERKKEEDWPFFHRLRPPDEHDKILRSNQWWRNPTGL
ncbi:hypothetical protein TUM17562_50250 [Klebsiella pneumoniae]|nr:hypothetical protein TUM17562_50250 [Klebsiella pneumoniae]GJK77901.1 hypothetical protein TUM17565_51140 [Klebsiella pneumoniae]